jgi:hypothetical protein
MFPIPLRALMGLDEDGLRDLERQAAPGRAGRSGRHASRASGQGRGWTGAWTSITGRFRQPARSLRAAQSPVRPAQLCNEH